MSGFRYVLYLPDFAVDSRPEIQRTATEAAKHVALSIHATREAVDAAGGPDWREPKDIAEQQYEYAGECLDELDRTFAAHRWTV